MDINTTRPIEEIDKTRYANLISGREISISPHALDHLSQRQRKVFKEEELIHMISKEVPRKAFLQNNGRYAAYFRKTDGYRKLIIEIKDSKAIIITFMDVIELPRIRFENE